MGAKIKKTSLKDGFSAIRNEIVGNSKHSWHFYLYPWEIIRGGHSEILTLTEGKPNNYKFLIVQGNTIIKETRLWNKGLNIKFVNPVYETLNDKNATITNGLIFSKQAKDDFNKFELVNEWKNKSPTDTEPHYYLALSLLEQQKYDQFLLAGEQYLFREFNDIHPITMMRYYRSLVFSQVKKDAKNAMESAISCLAANTMMAEFWCALGDAHYVVLKDYKKAHKFYENAVSLGAERHGDDDWPMDVSKYKEYPAKMMKSCSDLLKSKKYIGV
tara:strand:- start:337 stop:1152 length:816 start_codon:yes stop_codon:yes gene_type:complete